MKKAKNLIFFAGVIIAILMLGNIIEYSYLLWWKSKYGADMDAFYYSKYLMLPISDFHNEYHQWPGPSGPIDEKFIHELEGDADATINVHHIDFYKKNHLNVMIKNKFGDYFYFKIYEKSPVGFFIEHQPGLPGY